MEVKIVIAKGVGDVTNIQIDVRKSPCIRGLFGDIAEAESDTAQIRGG